MSKWKNGPYCTVTKTSGAAPSLSENEFSWPEVLQVGTLRVSGQSRGKDPKTALPEKFSRSVCSNLYVVFT